MVDPRIEVDECHVVDTPEARRASKHLPMVADLRLGVPAAYAEESEPMVSG